MTTAENAPLLIRAPVGRSHLSRSLIVRVAQNVVIPVKTILVIPHNPLVMSAPLSEVQQTVQLVVHLTLCAHVVHFLGYLLLTKNLVPNVVIHVPLIRAFPMTTKQINVKYGIPRMNLSTTVPVNMYVNVTLSVILLMKRGALALLVKIRVMGTLVAMVWTVSTGASL